MLKIYIDKHKDKMAFILGTGPSLRNIKPELLKPHVTIAVNGAILKAPEADYYFSCDNGMVLWKSWLTLKDLKCKLILASNSGFGAFQHVIKDRGIFDGISMLRIDYLPRKKDNIFDKGDKLIKGSSSVHAAVHFAWVMGCSPIVLIGCECKYVGGKKHYWDFPNQPDEGLVNLKHNSHRRPLSKSNPGGTTDGELNHHRNVWRLIRKLNPQEINIIDASGGNYEYFQSNTLEEILK